MFYEDPMTSIDIEKQTLMTNSGKQLKYGSLIIATGCTATRYPEVSNLYSIFWIIHINGSAKVSS
jgi:NADH dehydrogenase FAD-containing subunit